MNALISKLKKIAACAVIAFSGMSVYAGDTASWTDAQGVTWEFDYTDADHTAVLRGATGYTDTLDIPATVKVGGTQYRVDAIQGEAFSAAVAPGFLNIKTVVIPDSLTLIEPYAFNGCSKLAAVTFDGDPMNINMVASSFNGTPYLARVNANDKFANAITLTGTEGFATGCNILASAEPGEPDDHNGNENRSLWWKWKAPADVTTAAFHTFASSFDTVIGVYTGTSVNALTEVAFNDDRLGESLSFAKCAVTPGQIYYIRVSGFGQSGGDVNLCWKAANGFSCVDIDGLMVGFTGNCPANVTIPKTITWIMKGAFDGSEYGEDLGNLKSVTMPESVVGIQEGAFYTCPNLSSVTFGRGLLILEYGAFNACSSLVDKTLYLPWTVEDAAGDSFCEFGGALTVQAPDTLSDQLYGGTYGEYGPTVLTASYYTPSLDGLTTVTLYPEGGKFGLGVPVGGEDGSTSIHLQSGLSDWSQAFSRKPTRPGYAFGGFWASGHAQEVWDENMKFKGNTSYWTSDGKWKYTASTLDVHAVWDRLTYTVTFNPTNGKVSRSTKVVQSNGTYGPLPAATQDGYDFIGWFTERSGGTQVTETTKVTQKCDHTLFAHWKAKTFTVSFNPTNGSVEPKSKTVQYNKAYGALPVATQTGYNFLGWFTERSGGTQVTETTKVTQKCDHTLFAHWKKAAATTTYTVTFNPSGGTVSPTTRKVASGAKLGTLPVATQTGYDFVGWFTEKSGGTQVTANTIVTKNVTYYAHWKAKTFTVSFNPTNGSVNPKSKTVQYNRPYGALPVATQTGYNFLGWFTERSGGTQVTDTTKMTRTADHTLFAHWKKAAK